MMTQQPPNEFKTVTNISTGETTDSYVVNAKEIEIIKREVSKDDIVLDIGANVGFLTRILAEQAKYVYAFEPSPYNFKELEENTKHLNNVYTYQVALSNEFGIHTLYLCPHDNGMNRLYPSKWCEGGDRITVMAVNLDNVISSHSKIKFIKIDVEGLEYRVIEGMRQLLQRDHPTILMEFHPPSMEEALCHPESLYHVLKHEMGYQDPINVNTGETIASYEELDKQTRDTPAVNILWKYNS